MFGLASGLYETYLVSPEVSLLVIGLDEAGKSTLLERVKVTEFENTNKAPPSGKRIAVQKVAENPVQVDSPAGKEKSSNGHHHGHKRTSPQQRKSSHGFSKKQSSDSSLVKPTKRRLFSCPAPKIYQNSRIDSDSDVSDSELDPQSLQEQDNTEATSLLQSESVDSHNSLLEDDKSIYLKNHDGIIELPSSNHDDADVENSNADGNDTATNGNRDASASGPQSSASSPMQSQGNSKINSLLEVEDSKEYDLKAGKTMFPLHLIRPTLGMNLAKIQACGAKVRIMDLGGQIKMRPLWERYYSDIHGIAFVIDVSPSCPVSKLMEARAFYRCMRDDENLLDCPILIFANKMDTRKAYFMKNSNDQNGKKSSAQSNGQSNDIAEDQEDASMILGDTSLLDIAELFLSHPKGASKRDLMTTLDYAERDDNVAFFAGSAKSGEGVRSAFEWLIQKGSVKSRKMQRGG